MTTAQPWSRMPLESSISTKTNVARRTAALFAAPLLVGFFWLVPTPVEGATCVAEVDSRATAEVIIYGAVLENLPAEGEVPPLSCNGNGEFSAQTSGESATGVPALLPSAGTNGDTPESGTEEASAPPSNGDAAAIPVETDEAHEAPGEVVAISDTVAEESPSIPAAAAPVEEPSAPQAPEVAEAPEIEVDDAGSEQSAGAEGNGSEVEPDQTAESEPSVVEAGINGDGASPGEEQTAVNTLPLIATVYFEAGSSSLNAEGEILLKETAVLLKADEGLRVQLLAYSAEDPDVPNAARRTSLSRALEVRKFLTGEGVASVRLQIRALGAKVPQGDPDRVDIQSQGG